MQTHIRTTRTHVSLPVYFVTNILAPKYTTSLSLFLPLSLNQSRKATVTRRCTLTLSLRIPKALGFFPLRFWQSNTSDLLTPENILGSHWDEGTVSCEILSKEKDLSSSDIFPFSNSHRHQRFAQIYFKFDISRFAQIFFWQISSPHYEGVERSWPQLDSKHRNANSCIPHHHPRRPDLPNYYLTTDSWISGSFSFLSHPINIELKRKD